MLEYAVRLTRHPHGSDRGVAALRAVGFTDADVLDICQVAAYYNYVNRLADGLGVELEDDFEGGDPIVTRAEFDQWRAERPRA